MIDYDDNGQPAGIAFAIETERGLIGFQLPANIEGVKKVFQKQKVKANEDQAQKTAWRNVRDWVLAQMAFIEAGNAELEEAFLPYLTNSNGRTLYQTYCEERLMLK